MCASTGIRTSFVSTHTHTLQEGKASDAPRSASVSPTPSEGGYPEPVSVTIRNLVTSRGTKAAPALPPPQSLPPPPPREFALAFAQPRSPPRVEHPFVARTAAVVTSEPRALSVETQAVGDGPGPNLPKPGLRTRLSLPASPLNALRHTVPGYSEAHRAYAGEGQAGYSDKAAPVRSLEQEYKPHTPTAFGSLSRASGVVASQPTRQRALSDASDGESTGSVYVHGGLSHVPKPQPQLSRPSLSKARPVRGYGVSGTVPGHHIL